MKKFVILLVILSMLFLFSSGAFAEGSTIESVYDPGDFTVSGSVGFGYGFSLAIYPGAEFFIAQTRVGDVLPLDFGVAARGFFNTYSTSNYGYDWGWTAFGLGAFGTVHLSFQEFDIDFKGLDNLDFYIGLGLKFDSFTYTGDYASYYDESYAGIGFASIAGVNYYLNNNWALVLEGNYWGNYGGGLIGILYKF